MPGIPGIGIGIPFKRGGVNWTAYWANLLSAPNSDLVQWNSIATIPSTGTGYSQAIYDADAKQGNFEFFSFKAERSLGYINISQIKIHNITTTNVSNIIFTIWEWDGVNYNRIFIEDIKTKLTNTDQIHTITLTPSINIKEASFTSLFLKRTGSGSGINCGALISQTNGMVYRVNLDYDTTPFNWLTGTSLNFYQPIHLMGTAPMIIGIGDSMMESYPLHTSMVDVTRTQVYVTKSWMYKLYNSDNRFIYQDCGIGDETTTEIEARFNRDVVLKKPKLAVINGGVNDIDHAVSKVTFLAKWTSMLDMCKNSNIIPIVWKIMPCNNLSNAQMQTRDDWNASLLTLFNTYTIKGKKIIDWDSILGVNRVGGDPGNLWNINPTYAQGDGTHLNEAGQALLASTVLALFS